MSSDNNAAKHSRLGGVGLDAAASLQCPVFVLHCPHIPPLCRPVILQLELLVLGNLFLVSGDIHTCEQEDEVLYLLNTAIFVYFLVAYFNFISKISSWLAVTSTNVYKKVGYSTFQEVFL